MKWSFVQLASLYAAVTLLTRIGIAAQSCLPESRNNYTINVVGRNI